MLLITLAVLRLPELVEKRAKTVNNTIYYAVAKLSLFMSLNMVRVYQCFLQPAITKS